MEHKYLKPILDDFWLMIGMEKMAIEINENLLEVFKQTAKDFLRFLPIDVIEKVFLENWRKLDNSMLSDWINNLHLHVLYDRLGEIEYDWYKSHKNWDQYTNPQKIMRPIEEKIFESNKAMALIYRSQKWWNQTQYELDKECQDAAIECGFDIDDLTKRFLEIRSGDEKIYYSLDEKDDKAEIEKINEFKKDFLLKMVKIYICLRKKGYSHSDIIA